MTIDNILDQLDRIAEDSSYTVIGNFIDLTIYDFIGFNEDGSEIFREYVDPEEMEEVINWLIEKSDYIEGSLYRYIHFGNILVRVGYNSFEI